MSAHPADVECRRVEVEELNGFALRARGLFVRDLDEHSRQLDPLDGVVAMELFGEAQADAALARGEPYRFEAGHGSSRHGPPHVLEPWSETTPGAGP